MRPSIIALTVLLMANVVVADTWPKIGKGTFHI
jgi:hypothetical protein